MPRQRHGHEGNAGHYPARGEGWLYEIKWDGVRAICFVDNGAVRFTSRSGKSCERQYPELSVLANAIDAQTACSMANLRAR